MSVRRMMGAAALGAAATTLAFVPGAGAQEGPAYTGSSTGEAFNLTVFGEGLTMGSTLAEVTPGTGTAKGAGVASPLFEAGVTSASETEPGSAEETCEGPIDQIPGLSIALACSSSQVTIGETTSTAAATARVGSVVVNPVAEILETPLGEVVAPVEDGVDQLLTGLEPVLGPIDEGTQLGVEDTLGELFDRLFAGADLATVTVGDSAATTSADATSVTTSCTSEGARIDVLSVLDAPPLISVIVGQAGTEVAVDRGTGTATPTVNPSLVTVESATLGPAPITVAVGQTIEIPLPEPFGTSFIRVADGATGTNEDGTTFATANAVSLDLLNSEALQGGIELELAGCTSVAGGSVEAPVTPAAPIELPTTGSDDPNPFALAGVAGLAGLGFALVRRSTPS